MLILKFLKRGKAASLSLSECKTWHSKVKPQPGSIICCFIYGLIEHTGIWLDEHTLIELYGRGLIRAVPTKYFLASSTGSKIFVACSHGHQVFSRTSYAEKGGVGNLYLP